MSMNLMKRPPGLSSSFLFSYLSLALDLSALPALDAVWGNLSSEFKAELLVQNLVKDLAKPLEKLHQSSFYKIHVDFHRIYFKYKLNEDYPSISLKCYRFFIDPNTSEWQFVGTNRAHDDYQSYCPLTQSQWKFGVLKNTLRFGFLNDLFDLLIQHGWQKDYVPVTWYNRGVCTYYNKIHLMKTGKHHYSIEGWSKREFGDIRCFKFVYQYDLNEQKWNFFEDIGSGFQPTTAEKCLEYVAVGLVKRPYDHVLERKSKRVRVI